MRTKEITRLYSDFDLGFTANPVTGDVSKKYDVNAVKQSLKNLILTQFYERPFQPNLGSPVYKLLFENLDAITANSIEVQIDLMINQFEPRVRRQQIVVEPDPDLNAYSVTITFYVYGIKDPAKFTTMLTRSR
jgi:phage baseplate assembly protein W